MKKSFSETDFVIGNCSNYLMDMADRGFVSPVAWCWAGTTSTTRRQDFLPQHTDVSCTKGLGSSCSAGLSLSDQITRETTAEKSTFACLAGRESTKEYVCLISVWRLGTLGFGLHNRKTYLYLKNFPQSQKNLAYQKKNYAYD